MTRDDGARTDRRPGGRRAAWVALAGLLVAAAVAYLCLEGRAGGDGARAGAESRDSGAKASGKEASGGKPAAKKERREKASQKAEEKDSDGLEDFSPADRALSQAVQTALDNEDLAATLKATARALKSSNAAVRLAAVEALGWFGEKTLTELTPCMADPDEEVAEAAMNAWELGLADLDAVKTRYDISLMALNVISNENALKMIGSQFSNAATDIIEDIEDEQAASAKRVEIIQSVFDMITSADELRSQVAKEIYEDITGNEWISAEEAERYLADPDNYEPPEDAKEAGTGGASENSEMSL